MKKNIAIICSLDGFANSAKPTKIKEFLENHGHTVTLINTYKINRLSVENGNIIYKKIPFSSFITFFYLIIKYFSDLINKFNTYFTKIISYYLLLIEIYLRSIILFDILSILDFDFIIGETQIDAFVFLKPLKATTIYDCPTPWADELFYGNFLPDKKYYKLLLKKELEIYKKVKYLSFHSEVYNQYINKYYYRGNNLMILNHGCIIRHNVANYCNKPKIVYIGCLGGYWINLKLLSKLSQIYPNIDVYGSPEPDKKYGLNYKGYANPDILSHYQFGLITISQDKLRKEGFSAKHLEYLSYGLPVLVPEWRSTANFYKGTLTFNEYNFLEVIKLNSKKKEWNKLKNEALNQANKMTWQKTLKPLLNIIN